MPPHTFLFLDVSTGTSFCLYLEIRFVIRAHYCLSYWPLPRTGYLTWAMFGVTQCGCLYLLLTLWMPYLCHSGRFCPQVLKEVLSQVNHSHFLLVPRMRHVHPTFTSSRTLHTLKLPFGRPGLVDASLPLLGGISRGSLSCIYSVSSNFVWGFGSTISTFAEDDKLAPK